MSQQRQCCCGDQQDFGHECLAYDKIFPAYRNSNGSPADFAASGRPSYQTRPQNPPRTSTSTQSYWRSRDGYSTGRRLDSVLPTRHQAYDASDPTANGLKTRNPDNTTGMGCMLCHGTLIMETSLPRYDALSAGYVTENCPSPGCCAAISAKISYEYGGWELPKEQTQYIMYNAYKDYWYLEVGPQGFPFSYRDEGPLPIEALYTNDNFYSIDDGRLGVRSFGGDVQQTSYCWSRLQHPAIVTDADLLCHPELTAMTNPANVHYGEGGEGGIYSAYDARKVGVDNNEPEMSDMDTSDPPYVRGNYLCTYMESNINPWVFDSGDIGGFNFPCGGNFMPGVSSWQAYICRSQPEYRTLGDTFSYGNGLPIFDAPSSVVENWNFDNPAGTEYSPLLGSMLGTLYRVRLWVRSDQVTINYRYPCEDVNGIIHSHYPPETNSRMRRGFNDGGYNPIKRLCGSGPASLMYACSGVPIFTSDMEMMKEQDYEVGTGILQKLSELYYGDWENTGAAAQAYDLEGGLCGLGVGQIEDSFGESGLYTAKDWRLDQLNKYSTIESEYKLIGEQNKTNPDLSDEDRLALEKLAEGVSVPTDIKTRIDPSGDIELLPAQKFGEMMLSCFITRASPKEQAGEEPGGQLLSEMAYFQSSEFMGKRDGFKIDYIDPWHPSNTGSDWPQLGRNRVDPRGNIPMSFTLQKPDGHNNFLFHYPVRRIWNAWRAQVNPAAGEFTDDEWNQVSPEWEQKLFKLWWKNNPVYFHTTPGGWSWAGDGQGNLPNRWICRWSNRPKYLGTLESLHQLKWFGTARAATYCGFNETWPNKTYKGIDSLINHSHQLRNKPGVRKCRTLAPACVLPARAKSVYNVCDGQPGVCCTGGAGGGGFVRCAGWKPGSGTCSGIPECACNDEQAGYVMYNCCELYTPYSGSNREGTRSKATSYYFREDPISVNTGELAGELLDNWNKNNPSQSFKDGSLYGSRCTEQGNCPPKYKCCSPSGCGGDNFCVPQEIECDTEPCSSSNNFNSPCCNTFGSCCYVDDDGVTRCEETSKEKCIAPKSNGGLAGIFNKDTECGSYPCRTDAVSGTCFYTDPLLNHQICRQTFSDTCTDMGGEFFANQDCSEFTDKMTTAFERKTGLVGNKPTKTGDKICGEYGFTVNCCTETTNSSTGEVSHVCETKCMSDCDHGINGKSRIVSECEACGELGHCCTLNGVCESNVTKAACSGTWFPGAECEIDSCAIPLTENWVRYSFGKNLPGTRPYRIGDVPDPDPEEGDDDGDNQGCDFTPCADKNLPPSATLDVCLPASMAGTDTSLATQWAPYPPTSNGDPGLCHVSRNAEAFRSCTIRQVQASRSGLRYTFFRSRQDSDGFNSSCPIPNSGQATCCDYSCNPAYYNNLSLSCDPQSGPQGDWTMHRDMGTIVSFVYPWRVRCKEVRDEQGLYRCGVQQVSNRIEPTEMPIGIIGACDILTCHFRRIYPGGEVAGIDRCNSETPICTLDGDGPDAVPVCDNETGDGVEVIRYTNATYENGFTAYLPHVNDGGVCLNMRDGLRRAFSIPFEGDASGQQHLYGPPEGVGGILKKNCPSSYVAVEEDAPPRAGLPLGTLGLCAEFYNDKLLSDFEGDGFPEPPIPTIELTFHDYGGLLNTYEDDRTEPPTDRPLGQIEGTPIGAELVDANWNGGENDPTFWLKQEYPGIKYIRFFSAGCFRLPGSHQGGWPQGITLDVGLDTEQRIGGGFAGTLVVVFGDEEECELFDESYGSENLKLSFLTTPPGYENVGDGSEVNPRITDDEIYFVGRPSFNLRNVEALGEFDAPPGGQDLSYSAVGYLNGLGLTYANVSNGDQGPYVGKVYEFCVPFGKGTGHVGQLKPIFTPGESIPAFSGLRGPIALYGDGTGVNGDKFIVQLERFTEKLVSSETLGTCLRYWSDPNDESGKATDIDYIGDNLFRGSDTAPNNGEYCFYAGYTFDDTECGDGDDDDGDGGEPGGGVGGGAGGGGSLAGGDGDDEDCVIVWDRDWYANLGGITDGGSIGCCQQDYPLLPCETWEFGGANTNAGNNVFRRANTSDDCRGSL